MRFLLGSAMSVGCDLNAIFPLGRVVRGHTHGYSQQMWHTLPVMSVQPLNGVILKISILVISQAFLKQKRSICWWFIGFFLPIKYKRLSFWKLKSHGLVDTVWPISEVAQVPALWFKASALVSKLWSLLCGGEGEGVRRWGTWPCGCLLDVKSPTMVRKHVWWHERDIWWGIPIYSFIRDEFDDLISMFFSYDYMVGAYEAVGKDQRPWDPPPRLLSQCQWNIRSSCYPSRGHHETLDQDLLPSTRLLTIKILNQQDFPKNPGESQPFFFLLLFLRWGILSSCLYSPSLLAHRGAHSQPGLCFCLVCLLLGPMVWPSGVDKWRPRLCWILGVCFAYCTTSMISGGVRDQWLIITSTLPTTLLPSRMMKKV